MGELINLDAHRASAHGWESCECRCERCGHTWMGVFERPVEALECPQGCGEWGFPLAWRVAGFESGAMVWSCGVCERQSFALLHLNEQTYTVCRHCGNRNTLNPEDLAGVK